jgi:hypothetical protein
MDTDPIEGRSAGRPIAIYLTQDEAMVLDAFLSRGQAAGDNYASIHDHAELRVLWDMQAILESWLPVMAADYESRLVIARDRVRDPTGDIDER